MRRGLNRQLLVLAASGGLAITGILFVSPGMAMGQAAVDQYIPSEKPGEGASRGPSDPPSAAGSSGSATGSTSASGSERSDPRRSGASALDAPSGTSSGVDIPLTSYPVTPFVAIGIGIAALGLVGAVLLLLRSRRGGPVAG